MAHTKDLLRLASEFPLVFADPESQEDISPSTTHCDLTDAKTKQLLQLIDQFPAAFANLELDGVEAENTLASRTNNTSQVTSASSDTIESHVPSMKESVPAGYAHALRRRVQTLTWGQVDFHLVYGDGLEELWLTVGKSGTEVQSLGEAICRLINLLLSRNVPIPEIIREIRGIRGADSEGLGPNRILGLADLIGKVLQEAPAQYGTAQIVKTSETSGSLGHSPQEVLKGTEHRATDDGTAMPKAEGISIPNLQPPPEEATWSENEASFSQVFYDTLAEASTLCPECGAELQQINGCKGGACVVCGHSSCS